MNFYLRLKNSLIQKGLNHKFFLTQKVLKFFSIKYYKNSNSINVKVLESKTYTQNNKEKKIM